MAAIAPFKGLRFNRSIIQDLSEVIAPPYDVIDEKQQQEYYHRNPYNIIRLEYGQHLPGDSDKDNRYTRAAKTLQQWLSGQVLQVENQPAFYLYEQTFSFKRQTYRRSGFFAALKLERYENKTVLPHEETLSHPKTDRMELLRHCRANFSPIFGLFPDPERQMDRLFDRFSLKETLFEFSDFTGQRHRVWAVDNPEHQQFLNDFLAPRPVLIADGHHRYETALQFSQENDLSAAPGAGYVLAHLVSLQNPGLVVLPTHRLLSGLDQYWITRIKQAMAEHFEIIHWGNPAKHSRDKFFAELKRYGRSRPALGFVEPGNLFILLFKHAQAGSHRLDVAILKDYIFSVLLDDAEEAEVEKHVSFSHDGEKTIRAVLQGEAQVAFLLNPTPIEQVADRSYRGERMPQKSTYFYPKLPSGLVIYHLDRSFK